MLLLGVCCGMSLCILSYVQDADYESFCSSVRKGQLRALDNSQFLYIELNFESLFKGQEYDRLDAQLYSSFYLF